METVANAVHTIVTTISQSSRPKDRMMRALTIVRREKAIHATARYAAEIPIMVFARPSRPMMMFGCNYANVCRCKLYFEEQYPSWYQ